MRLLISPESVAEADAVLSSGLDIVDVKNTAEGSLGAQTPEVISTIVKLASRYDVVVSATLGDLPFAPGTAALAAYGCASLGVGYIKAGLYGARSFEQAAAMMDAVVRAVRRVSPSTVVVAAGYADWRRFGGVSPLDVVRAARVARASAVMVDTAVKDGSSLFDAMSVEEIRQFVSGGHDAGLQVALAGGITESHLAVVAGTGADIVGVRGAVCERSDDRRSRISADKARKFVERTHALTATISS